MSKYGPPGASDPMASASASHTSSDSDHTERTKVTNVWLLGSCLIWIMVTSWVSAARDTNRGRAPGYVTGSIPVAWLSGMRIRRWVFLRIYLLLVTDLRSSASRQTLISGAKHAERRKELASCAYEVVQQEEEDCQVAPFEIMRFKAVKLQHNCCVLISLTCWLRSRNAKAF